MNDPIQVKFQNQVNPNSNFDLIKLEELIKRKSLDHDPEQLHKVEFYILFFISKGKGKHTIDFTDYKYQQGTLITIRKDQIHKFSKEYQSQGYLLIFTDEFLIRYLEKSEIQKSFQLFNELLGVPKIQLTDKEQKEIKEIIQRIEIEYLKVNDDYSSGIIRSELHILITKLYRIKSRKKKMIIDKKYLSEFIQFQTLVEQNVKQTTRVQDFAEMMAVSTKTLNTISKSIIHKTAKEFIDDIGTKQIKRLLLNTPLSIKEIAYESGFEETTNFYKYFKRQVGMTPEQFRATS